MTPPAEPPPLVVEGRVRLWPQQGVLSPAPAIQVGPGRLTLDEIARRHFGGGRGGDGHPGLLPGTYRITMERIA